MTIRYLLLYTLAAAIAFSSCKKDGNKPPEPKALLSGLTAAMQKADSISVFTAALKDLSLTEEETSQGITVFAPLDDNLSVATLGVKQPGFTISETGPSPAELTAAFMRAHIVKGIYKLADLTDGKTLTTLSGTTLYVSRSYGKLWVNGIMISGTEIAGNAGGEVYVVRTSLEGSQPNAFLFSEEELKPAIPYAESEIALWHKDMVMLDGFLSHDAEASSVPGALLLYQNIGNFRFGPADQTVGRLWDDGYSNITGLNELEVHVKAVFTDPKPWVSRIRTFRAYVYLQLLTYYENIPLIRTAAEGTAHSNADPTKAANFIRSELEAVSQSLPSSSSDIALPNILTAKVLMARYYLLRKEYQQVATLTSEVINSGVYRLEPADRIFSSGGEIIWDQSASMSSTVKSYFFGRDKLPYIRLAEVYLMNAEANFNLGNDAAARTAFSTLLQRRGLEQANLTLSGLQYFWRVELQREGLSFPALRRWNKAAEVLGEKGFVSPKHNRLPIPAREVMHSGMVQNEGY